MLVSLAIIIQSRRIFLQQSVFILASLLGFIISGCLSFAQVSKEVSVDGAKYTTPQSAIDALGGTGGTVYVPCGKYPGPTSIPSFTHVISRCKASPATPAMIGNARGIVADWASKNHAPATTGTATIFTYSSTVKPVFKAFGVEIRGVTFDFGGENAGLIIQGSTGGTYDIAVQNCGGSVNATPCLQILSYYNSRSDYFNTAENDFQRVAIETVPYGGSPGGIGLYIAGTGGFSETSVVTNNYFRSVFISNVKTGIQFGGADDSNDFGHVYINVNTAGGVGNGVAVNCGGVPNQDDSGEHFQFLEVDYTPGSPKTGSAVCLGNATAFTIDNLEIGGGWTAATELQTIGNPTYFIKRHYDIPGGDSAHGRIITTSDLVFARDNNSTLSSSPRSVWTTFVPSIVNGSGIIQSFWIPDKSITVTRITVLAVGSLSSDCSANFSFDVFDVNSNNRSPAAVIPKGINHGDTGPISFDVPGGNQLQLQYDAKGCSATSANINVVVEYKMR